MAGKRARHTELISVYIPPGYELAKVMNQLKQEQGTASNIKSTGTRKNVTGALEKLVQHLRLFKSVPKNGLAAFSGNTSTTGGDDFELFSIIPPLPIKTRMYLCEQKFFLDPLWEMTMPTEVYGLIVIERGGATVALLKGKRIEIVQDIRSMVPGKFKAGGQSSVRLANVRENLANDFYKKVGDAASEVFAPIKELKGVILGGAGPTKEEFLNGDFMHHSLKVIAVKDVGSDGEAGINELVDRSADVLDKEEVTREKNLVNELLRRLAKNEPVAYGEEEVRRALEAKAVETLLLSEDLEKVRVRLKCNCKDYWETTDNLEAFRNRMKGRACEDCGALRQIVETKDIISELSGAAETAGVTVELISTETPEGRQLRELGGVAAFLKFKI